MNFRTFCLGLVASGLFFASAAMAEPGWDPHVIARGQLKQQIEATPILERPYRPLHFYGNTVRREYYRGEATPRPRDLFRGSGAVIARKG